MILLIAIAIGFALGSRLLRRKLPAEGNAEAVASPDRAVKATVDGKPVHSYIVFNG